MKLTYFLFFLFLLLFTISCSAGEVTLAWDYDSSQEQLLGSSGGFRIYVSKTSMTYPSTPAISVPASARTAKINLSNGRWYFIATAFDSEGNESDYSNEVSGIVKPNKPTLLRITDIK